MIISIWEYVCRLYANMPFYIRDLHIHEFWYPQGPGTHPPQIAVDDYILLMKAIIVHFQKIIFKRDCQFWKENLLLEFSEFSNLSALL